MFKSPVRNQRSKGIKVKNVLQVCFLLAICFWLIYQVKHSHDKKKALEETGAKQSSGDILKLGRKDPILKDEKLDSNNGKLNEEVEDEEMIGNDEENKNEEEIQEETGDDIKDDEVDEIDEHELEKTDEEVDREEEEATEEEEKGEEERENKGKEGEEEREYKGKEGEEEERENKGKEGEEEERENKGKEGEDSTDSLEKSTHEAREENYKADDASSAVTQTSQGVEKSGKDNFRDENLVNVTNSDSSSSSSTGGREIAEIDVPLNTTTNYVVEEVADKSKNSSLPSSFGLSEESNDTAHINTVSDHLPVQNRTETEVNALPTMDDVTMSSENVDNVHNDPIDSSDSLTSLEEKNDEKDIEMLANVVLNEDVAAE